MLAAWERGDKALVLRLIKDGQVKTPACDAASGGKLRLLRWLVDEGLASLNEQGPGKLPVLMSAALGGHTHVAQWILSKNPNLLEARSDTGSTALILACRHGHSKLVRWLLEEAHAKLEASALFEAAGEGHLDIVQYLIQDHGQDPSQTNPQGYTVLFWAILNCQAGIVWWLLKEGGSSIKEKAVVSGATVTAYDVFQEAVEVLEEPDVMLKTLLLYGDPPATGAEVLGSNAASGHEEYIREEFFTPEQLTLIQKAKGVRKKYCQGQRKFAKKKVCGCLGAAGLPKVLAQMVADFAEPSVEEMWG